MPQIAEPAPAAYEPVPNRKRWTRNECDSLREFGLLDGAYELIDGEIIDKMGQKPAHRSAVILLRDWLIGVFGGARVQSQAPILLTEAEDDQNEPEPDVAVTNRAATEYILSNPPAEEILLVAEISDTTLRFDRIDKAVLYACAGIPEYWIVDLTGRRVLVHRSPTSVGYAEIRSYNESEVVSLIDHPEVGIRVGDLLPPTKSSIAATG